MHDNEGGYGEVDDKTADAGKDIGADEGRHHWDQAVQNQDELWNTDHGSQEAVSGWVSVSPSNIKGRARN